MSNFNEIHSLRIFIAIVDAKSLAKAASFLGQSSSSLSQRLTLLESKLGVKLLQRSTRRLQLTEEGNLLYQRGRLLLGELDELQRDILQKHDSLSGPLKIFGPLSFGQEYLAEIVTEFHSVHPGLDVSLTLSDRLSSHTRERFDLVVHIGEEPMSESTAYPIAPNSRFLCASPGYLKNAPPLAHPNDLIRHKCLVLRDIAEDSNIWQFSRGQETIRVRVEPSLCTNDGNVINRWVHSGKGILLRSEWAVAESIKRGDLVRLLPDWTLPGANILAVVPHIDGMPLRVKRFLEYFRERFRPFPGWRNHK
jgi:DNA-binding transcriptional LysR family regulator